jgi:general secretion pathway protein L
LLHEFLNWWASELLSVLPAWLREDSHNVEALIADVTEPGFLVLRRRRRGIEEHVARIAVETLTSLYKSNTFTQRKATELVVLCLPSIVVLERDVVLPLAAERDLESVLRLEMERLTPFTEENVYWTWRVEERDRNHGRLEILLTIIPKARVSEMFDLVSSVVGVPHLLEVITPTGPRVVKAHQGWSRKADGNLARHVLATIALALLILITVSPFLRQSLEIQEAQQRINAMSARVREVESLKSKLRLAAVGAEAEAQQVRRFGDILKALAAITDILPRDTYLTEFRMREREITISGMSSSAPSLIEKLSLDSRMRSPTFISPVRRNDSSHLDLFSIRVEFTK